METTTAVSAPAAAPLPTDAAPVLSRLVCAAPCCAKPLDIAAAVTFTSSPAFGLLAHDGPCAEAVKAPFEKYMDAMRVVPATVTHGRPQPLHKIRADTARVDEEVRKIVNELATTQYPQLLATAAEFVIHNLEHHKTNCAKHASLFLAEAIVGKKKASELMASWSVADADADVDTDAAADMPAQPMAVVAAVAEAIKAAAAVREKQHIALRERGMVLLAPFVTTHSADAAVTKHKAVAPDLVSDGDSDDDALCTHKALRVRTACGMQQLMIRKVLKQSLWLYGKCMLALPGYRGESFKSSPSKALFNAAFERQATRRGSASGSRSRSRSPSPAHSKPRSRSRSRSPSPSTSCSENRDRDRGLVKSSH